MFFRRKVARWTSVRVDSRSIRQVLRSGWLGKGIELWSSSYWPDSSLSCLEADSLALSAERRFRAAGWRILPQEVSCED